MSITSSLRPLCGPTVGRPGRRLQPARRRRGAARAGARLALARPGRADRLGPVLGAAGARAHAGRQRLAAGGRLLPRRAGRARRPVGAGLVQRHRRHAVEPERLGARRAGWSWAALGLCWRGHAADVAGAPSSARGTPIMANYIPVLDEPVVPGRAGDLRRRRRAAGAALPVARAERIGAHGRRRRRAALRPQRQRGRRPRWRCWRFGWSLALVPPALDGKAYYEIAVLGRRPCAAVHLDAADAGRLAVAGAGLRRAHRRSARASCCCCSRWRWPACSSRPTPTWRTTWPASSTATCTPGRCASAAAWRSSRSRWRWLLALLRAAPAAADRAPAAGGAVVVDAAVRRRRRDRPVHRRQQRHASRRITTAASSA